MAPSYLSFISILLICGLAAAAPRNKADVPDASTGFRLPISNALATDIIPNRYIVVYNNTFQSADIDAKESFFAASLKKRNLGKRALNGNPLSTTIRSLNMNSWRATILDADDDMFMEMYNSDEVAYIEADAVAHTQAVIAQTNPTPGLARLSNSQVGGKTYTFDQSAGENITCYIVDTGIRTTHIEFEGRATFGANFVDQFNTDQNGHGSHVAGTVAGATFGVAKGAQLVAVKVLGASGSGSNTAVLNGLQFVADDAVRRNVTGRAVMNMSLGSGFSQAVNRAVQAISDVGVVPVVAAGNENVDAAGSSPASAPAAITVGAIDDTNDSKATFSNFGPSVDIFAPGVRIISVGITNDAATSVKSGTSMASPHIAGLAAYLMSFQGLNTAAQVRAMLTNLADQTGAAVIGSPRGTTTRIANNGST